MIIIYRDGNVNIIITYPYPYKNVILFPLEIMEHVFDLANEDIKLLEIYSKEYYKQ